MNRIFGPLPAAHPLIGRVCFVCGIAFAVNDITTLIAIGPPPDGAMTVEGMPVHATCAGATANDVYAAGVQAALITIDNVLRSAQR